MPKLIKPLRVFILLSLSLIFLTCENDSDFIQKKNDSNTKLPYLTKKVKYEQLETNNLLLNKLGSIEVLNNNAIETESSKIIYVPQYDFYIDTDESNYVESTDGSYHSYTFPIVYANNQNVGHITNLLLSYNRVKDSYDAYIVKYEINTEENEKILNNQFVNLSNKTSMILLKDFNTDTVLNSLIAVIDQSTGDVTCWDEVYGMSSSTGWEGQVIGYTQVQCNWAGAGSDSGDSGSGYSGNGGSGGNSSGSSTTGGGGSTSGSGGSITTTPIAINYEKIRQRAFINSQLNTDQLAWFTNQDENTKNSIFQYLKSSLIDSNGLEQLSATEYPQEAMDYVFDFINNSIETGLDFDFEVSVKSPANIDFGDIEEDQSPEGIKFKCIYKKLTNSPTFKNLFLGTFGDNEKLNIKFEIANNLPVNWAGSCSPTQLSGGNYKTLIRINKSILDGSKSNIYIAKCIIHECIHAYLNIKNINENLGSSIPELSNMNFEEVIGTYYQGFNGMIIGGVNQSQHEFIFDILLPVLTNSLSEILNSLESQEMLNQVNTSSNYEFYNPLTMSFEPFSWADLLYNTSLIGLQNSPAFQTDIINDTLKKGKFDHYSNIGLQNLTKTCQ